MKILVIGGCGFIGSHLVDRLILDGHQISIYDNLSVGKLDFVKQAMTSGLVSIHVGDTLDLNKLNSVMPGHDVVFHLSANPEARNGLKNTKLDLEQGTISTYNVLESMRLSGVKNIIFSSSGTVYGNVKKNCEESDLGSLPISLYGASKLASEALIASFVECFDLNAKILRFGNIVGSRATHGVILDFFKKLKEHPEYLDVLGDGYQTKPYVHVSDCVEGLNFVLNKESKNLDIFNLSPMNFTSVRTIASLCVKATSSNSRIEYSGTSKGWPGDVTVSNLCPDKLYNFGFRVRYTSNQAVDLAVKEVYKEIF